MADNVKIGKRIKQRREELNLTLDDIAAEVGVAKSTIQRYEKGNIVNLKLPVLHAIAKALDVNPLWICDKSDIMELDKCNSSNLPFSNILPFPKMKKIPLLGTIACGEPILATENIEDYVDLPEHIHADFSLRCEGDSMINARILDGDVVYIRQQPDVDNGEIAAVLIDNEATLKRVYKYPNKLVLQPENPAYEPLVYVGEELEEIRILGKAVYFTSCVR